MNLAFHPTHPKFPGKKLPIPASWKHHLAPWSTAIYRENDFGSVLIQELVCQNFGIFIWTLDIQKAVCLYPTAKTPTIAIQFTLEGNISCILKGFGNKLLEKGNYEMFYIPMGFNEAWFEPGLYESLHIELQPAYLEELTTIRPEIKDLISRLQNLSSRGMPMALTHINYITSAILQNLRICIKEGASLQLEIHKYILELLSEYFAGILKKEEDKGKKNIHNKDLIIKIKNHILSAPDIQNHTLEKLAILFGINETSLKRDFKSPYNLTVADFVRYHVMTKSHFLLTTTRKTVDEIAEEVGYAWRPAFDKAFKQYFKYSPIRLRNDLNSYK
jgi:AraC-like DNA-binding protein